MNESPVRDRGRADPWNMTTRGRRLHLREVTDLESSVHGSLGAELRALREKRGEDLPTVARALRIRPEHLQALEEARYQVLPGMTYAVGFARAYGEYLGCDGDEVAARFKAETSAGRTEADLHFPEPVQETRIPGPGALIGATLFVALLFGAWYLAVSQNDIAVERIPAVPERLVSSSDGDAANRAIGEGSSQGAPDRDWSAAETADERSKSAVPSAPGDDIASISTAAAVAEVDPAAPDTSLSAVDATDIGASEVTTRPDGLADTASAELGAGSGAADAAPSSVLAAGTTVSESLPTGGVFGAPEREAQVVLRATGDAWVQVDGPDGDIYFTRILRAGDVFRAPPAAGYTLMTGNAGALEIIVDGESRGLIGEAGAVRRGIPLNAVGLAEMGL